MGAVPITLAGPWNVLLSHMALIGAAAMVDEALGAGSARIRWTDEADSRPQIAGEGLSAESLGQIVQEHARRHVDDEAGWLHAIHPVSGSLFSARTKMPTSEEGWSELLAARAAAARDLRGMDSAMTAGLGERAWWLREHKVHRPDHGASAWEMRTRNKGMEFIAHALLPAGRAVAARDVAEVTSGLLGQTVRDEPGKDKPDSRTATGLAPLGPADSARVWAGLWGLSAVPVWAVTHGRSVTSASLPPQNGHRGRLVMPVPARWITVARMNAALRSGYPVAALERESADATAGSLRVVRQLEVPRALEEWGFSQLLQFPVRVSGSTSAPERRALAGEAVS